MTTATKGWITQLPANRERRGVAGWEVERSAAVVAVSFSEPNALDEAWWSSKRAFMECYTHIASRAFESVGGTVLWLMAHLCALVSPVLLVAVVG